MFFYLSPPAKQAGLPGELALAGPGGLLLDDAADDTVRDTAAGADLHLHPDRDRRLGQTTSWRGGKLPRPADGQIEAQGRWRARKIPTKSGPVGCGMPEKSIMLNFSGPSGAFEGVAGEFESFALDRNGGGFPKYHSEGLY